MSRFSKCEVNEDFRNVNVQILLEWFVCCKGLDKMSWTDQLEGVMGRSIIRVANFIFSDLFPPGNSGLGIAVDCPDYCNVQHRSKDGPFLP